jgi:hypothetical protein
MRYLSLVVLGAVLAGCGGSGGPAPDTAASPPRRAPTLVSFQRNGGMVATLDAVLVRTDGWTRSDKRYGGAGRRYEDFHLRADMLARLRAQLARLPARPPRARAGAAQAPTYLVRYRSTTYYARGGAVPHALRPAIATLQAIVDGGGR